MDGDSALDKMIDFENKLKAAERTNGELVREIKAL
jgi:hypothetical protein